MEQFEEPKNVSDEHRHALAKMYADRALRDYLEKCIRIANENVIRSLKKGDERIARDYVARIDSFRQLLEKGKTHFVHFETIERKLKEPLGSAGAKEVKL